MSKNTVYRIDISGAFMFLLFLVFLVLKLTDHIDWSWWYVTMPLWLGIVLVLGLACFGFIIYVIIFSLRLFLNKSKKKF